MRTLDYSNKIYQNPHFRKNDKRGKRIFQYLFILIILVGAFFYFINYSNYFIVKNIEIFGNENIDAIDLRSMVNQQLKKKQFIIFGQNNILFFDAKAAQEEISKRYILSEIKIIKVFPDNLKVVISEKKSTIFWIANQKGYYLDRNGAVIAPASDKQVVVEKMGGTEIIRPTVIQQRIPIVYDENNEGVDVGQLAITKAVSEFVVALADLLSENFKYEIIKFNYNGSERRLSAVTMEGWLIHFNIDDNLEIQINNLNTVLSKEIKDTKNLKYVDLRFGEKVFYK